MEKRYARTECTKKKGKERQRMKEQEENKEQKEGKRKRQSPPLRFAGDLLRSARRLLTIIHLLARLNDQLQYLNKNDAKISNNHNCV